VRVQQTTTRYNQNHVYSFCYGQVPVINKSDFKVAEEGCHLREAVASIIELTCSDLVSQTTYPQVIHEDDEFSDDIENIFDDDITDYSEDPYHTLLLHF